MSTDMFPQGFIDFMYERSRTVEAGCEVMHDAYERAAVGAGWETNPASRKPWADVPEANKATMRAAVGALLDFLDRKAEQERKAANG